MVARKSGTHRLRGRSDRARISALTRSLEALLSGDVSTVVEVGPPDELGALERAAQQTVARLIDALVTVGRGAEALNDGWRQVLEMSNQMSETAEKTAAMADATAAASAQVSNNVQLVASATEELGATIREVAVHASEASRVAVDASTQAATATVTVDALSESSQRVERVVELIQSIAGQTHLLALNATIEAARAGDAGLGFSVVAGEVKSLASETARATGQVSQSVQEIQSGSDQAGRAITEIAETIRRVTENQVAIAAAVEQQTAATHEIGRGASEAAQGSVSIASNVAKLAADARSTAYAGTLARLSATQIADVTLELERLVAGFDLADLIAAVQPTERGGIIEAYVVNGATVVEDSVLGTDLNQFDYQGSWAHGVANADADANDDGTNSYSSMTGDVATLRFVGTQVRYFAVTDSHHGVGAVSVDGGPEVLVDLHSAARTCGVQLWQSPVLAYGEHVFSVRVTGERNAQSRYLWVNIDRVEIV